MATEKFKVGQIVRHKISKVHAIIYGVHPMHYRIATGFGDENRFEVLEIELEAIPEPEVHPAVKASPDIPPGHYPVPHKCTNCGKKFEVSTFLSGPPQSKKVIPVDKCELCPK